MRVQIIGGGFRHLHTQPMREVSFRIIIGVFQLGKAPGGSIPHGDNLEGCHVKTPRTYRQEVIRQAKSLTANLAGNSKRSNSLGWASANVSGSYITRLSPSASAGQ